MSEPREPVGPAPTPAPATPRRKRHGRVRRWVVRPFVWGGLLVAALLAAGLVDELRLLVHPVLGAPGPHFFSEQLPLTTLTLVISRPLALGVVALTYQPRPAPAGTDNP